MPPATWRGWLALLFSFVLLGFVTVREIHPFLAVSHPAPGGVLVVEGWATDAALAEALAEFKRHHYDKLYVTGGPLLQGTYLSKYNNFAELGAATLLALA